MKKTMLVLMTIIIFVFIVATYIIGDMVYDGTVADIPNVSASEMSSYYEEHKPEVINQLAQYESETVMIESEENDYEIEVLNVKSNSLSNDVVVVVHGITSNYYEVLDTAFMYLENNYNVVVYHQRQTGLTGGDNFTFGLYEQYDLDAVVQYVESVYSKGIVGVHGFSMGAATSAMHAKLNEVHHIVDFYILDAPYHTMESALELGIIGKDIPLIPISYALWAGDVMIQANVSFGYDDVLPIESIAMTQEPVMFIHGMYDAVTPPESSQYMYDAIEHDEKELWYADVIGHCTVHEELPEEYEARVFEFIETYVK